MMVSWPFFAPCSPPETGASTKPNAADLRCLGQFACDRRRKRSCDRRIPPRISSLRMRRPCPRVTARHPRRARRRPGRRPHPPRLRPASGRMRAAIFADPALGPRSRTVVDGDVMSGARQMPRHGIAHHAQADESDATPFRSSKFDRATPCYFHTSILRRRPRTPAAASGKCTASAGRLMKNMKRKSFA